jgi:hypothetical protein
MSINVPQLLFSLRDSGEGIDSMNTTHPQVVLTSFSTTVIGMVCFLLSGPSAAGQINSSNAVGYVNTTFVAGTNLIGNPLDAESNSLSALFQTPPDEATILLWDPASQTFSERSDFTAGLGWSPDVTLVPGQGALLYSGQAFLNTFVGRVLGPDGSPSDGSVPVRLPSLDLPAGTYLLSCKAPMDLRPPKFPVFPYVLGRGPRESEQFKWFDVSSQTYHTTTFSGGAWDNGEPFLPLGTSAFFRINNSGPTLRATFSGHELVVFWAASAGDFSLESCTSFSAKTVWTPVTTGIASNATGFAFTNTSPTTSGFYRLQKQ